MKSRKERLEDLLKTLITDKKSPDLIESVRRALEDLTEAAAHEKW